MGPELDRDLRRLAKRYRITFKPLGSSDQWPAAHRTTFENIRKIGDQRFDSFCANVDIHSNDQPWREQTKNRAEWLAKRASHLFNQQRNEAGWRFGLENDILRRFNFEVACPKCRGRIWRSEVEAHIKESDSTAIGLEERRKSRLPCNCPPEYRPLDYYEIGTNPLFDDRTEEVIIHDSLLRSVLPRQEPDRVYGLQATSNIQRLLSEPAVNSLPGGERPSLGESIRTSPFKDGVEPLLFPFLILEAKSEKSSNGFGDIQTQTAFPILALLKLQEDLRTEIADIVPETSPLVWFFANRGDAWRVYGCYVTTDDPPRYDIVHLWDGCVMARDDALRLLLIVDYVFDWARDVYRPSILRQLKSLITGEAYSQVRIATDSDIFSLRRSIANWIQPPPTTIDRLDLDEQISIPIAALDQENKNIMKIGIPNIQPTMLGYASLVNSRLSDEDLADIFCILHPASIPAHLAATLISREMPQHAIRSFDAVRFWEKYARVMEVDTFELAAHSHDIALRLSAKLKHHGSGFYFGRNSQRCDIIIGEHEGRVSNKHFSIYIDELGILMLEDHSTNGTIVDGVMLRNRSRYSSSVDYRQPLKQGSIIILIVPPDQDYRFIVHIPQRNTEREKVYQQNLAASSLGTNHIQLEREESA